MSKKQNICSMKIALAQQNYHIGNFESNTEKIVKAIQEAQHQQAELVIFSELSVCGYPPRDFLEFEDFISKCYEAIETIKHHTRGIGVVIGAPRICYRSASTIGSSPCHAPQGPAQRGLPVLVRLTRPAPDRTRRRATVSGRGGSGWSSSPCGRRRWVRRPLPWPSCSW